MRGGGNLQYKNNGSYIYLYSSQFRMEPTEGCRAPGEMSPGKNQNDMLSGANIYCLL